MFDVSFSENMHFDTGFSENINPIREHESLVGRDKENQHPIEAITELSQRLQDASGEALSNIELETLLK